MGHVMTSQFLTLTIVWRLGALALALIFSGLVAWLLEKSVLPLILRFSFFLNTGLFWDLEQFTKNQLTK